MIAISDGSASNIALIFISCNLMMVARSKSCSISIVFVCLYWAFISLAISLVISPAIFKCFNIREDGGEGKSGVKLSYEILYQKLCQKSFLLITTNIYGLQEFPLKQLWYLHAVLFDSPAA